MAFKFSTGLRKHQVFDGSVVSALSDCVIRFYSGAVPSSPDAALSSNTLLCEISDDGLGVGLSFSAYNAANPATLTKDLSTQWQGDVLASGVVTFYRLCKKTDTGSNSTSDIRIQGTVSGNPNADLIITEPNLVVAAIQRIEYFAMTLVEFV